MGGSALADMPISDRISRVVKGKTAQRHHAETECTSTNACHIYLLNHMTHMLRPNDKIVNSRDHTAYDTFICATRGPIGGLGSLPFTDNQKFIYSSPFMICSK